MLCLCVVLALCVRPNMLCLCVVLALCVRVSVERARRVETEKRGRKEDIEERKGKEVREGIVERGESGKRGKKVCMCASAKRGGKENGRKAGRKEGMMGGREEGRQRACVRQQSAEGRRTGGRQEGRKGGRVHVCASKALIIARLGSGSLFVLLMCC